jgi:hypothetical protein
MSLEKRASPKAHHVSVPFECRRRRTRPLWTWSVSSPIGAWYRCDPIPMKATTPSSNSKPAPHTYRFRYLVDGRSWENDWAADLYVPNGYGGDDSVVDVRRPERYVQDDQESRTVRRWEQGAPIQQRLSSNRVDARPACVRLLSRGARLVR